MFRSSCKKNVFIIFVVLTSLPAQALSFVDDLRITPVVSAVKKSKASVVNISTGEQVYERTNPFSSFGRDPFFDRFFQDFFDNRYPEKSVKTHLGSGVIIDSRGFVVTNWHVIEKAASIMISTADEHEYKATLIGADPKSDLAVLKINAQSRFTNVPLGDSAKLLIGETVIAIGNPFGLSHTVTTGVVSALHRSIKSGDQLYENFIQTDASINPGNSGGPLLNIFGDLIGINTAIYGKAEGIGFAIPVNTVKRIVADLVKFGEVRPPWIGIEVQDLTPGVAEHLGYSGTQGVIISEVVPDSPARQHGLQSADIILAVGEQKIKSTTSYKRCLSLYTAGTSVDFTLFRQGRKLTLQVKAAEYPLKYIDTLLWDDLGIAVINNSRRTAQQYGLHTASGVVLSKLKRGGSAYEKGLRPGDVILKVQGDPVADTEALKKQLIRQLYQNALVLLVQRGPYGYYVTFEW